MLVALVLAQTEPFDIFRNLMFVVLVVVVVVVAFVVIVAIIVVDVLRLILLRPSSARGAGRYGLGGGGT